MGWPVVLTDQSQDDLREIVCFIARDNSERARRFGNELIDQALCVGNFPEMGRIVPEIGDPEVREIIHGSYRIVYEILRDPNTVFVLRFWHAARGKPEIRNG
ncbi:MAG: type II toxin-antitoxin system RelE/ParE family toxin [Terrimicrobiaceae bacterium]